MIKKIWIMIHLPVVGIAVEAGVVAVTAKKY
jgi:hypothetical protein